MKELAKLRKSKRLTQGQLAEKAGMDQATVSKIESNSDYNYTAETIGKLAAALDVEPAELLGLPELQQRILKAIREIEDPVRQEAAIVVLESMARPSKD